MIIKTNRGWEVKSHNTGKCMGLYSTKKEAGLRLKQIKLFSKVKNKKWNVKIN